MKFTGRSIEVTAAEMRAFANQVFKDVFNPETEEIGSIGCYTFDEDDPITIQIRPKTAVKNGRRR